MHLKNFLPILIATLLLASCSAPKKVPYLVDAESIPPEVLAQASKAGDAVIVPGDLLNIHVYASNPAAVAQFNKGQYVDENGSVGIIQTQTSYTNSTTTSTESYTDYYLVNENGNIEFPTLGTLHVSGLDKSQIAELIKNAIYPKYIKIVPSVEVRLMNFKVTVLGQVKNPGVYTSPNERFNLLEALAKAGDLDIKGERQNVMLIRTNVDGTREVHRLNLQDRELLVSPYFNLQQNDFIYVEPNSSAKQNAWQMPPAWTTALSIIGTASSLASLVVGIVNLSK